MTVAIRSHRQVITRVAPCETGSLAGAHPTSAVAPEPSRRVAPSWAPTRPRLSSEAPRVGALPHGRPPNLRRRPSTQPYRRPLMGVRPTYAIAPGASRWAAPNGRPFCSVCRGSCLPGDDLLAGRPGPPDHVSLGRGLEISLHAVLQPLSCG